ncbi:MAG: ABC transporter substrate-binding protein [Lachnospiraceae bacterium]|nr:ABC transporter substrate-binding protein [Lachnospiraceae bacterium]
MNNKFLKILRSGALLSLTSVMLICGCGGAAASSSSAVSASSGTHTEETKENSSQAGTEDTEEAPGTNAAVTEAPKISGLEAESVMDLKYAQCFDVFYYKDGYKLIDIHDSAKYLLVPEGKTAPEGLDSDIIVLQQPLKNIYLAATSAMALFDSIDSLDVIRFTGTQASGWYVENAVNALNSGKMIFAGKYSEPDYEMLVDNGCDLAIQSTMILHVPKVQEMIETLGIPVFVDRSSYESHPLGRTEWIKVYGAMVDKEDTAASFFDQQAEVIQELKDFPNTEKTIAFFYVSTDGSVVVRKSTDYIPKMIEIAGGRYVFDAQVDSENTQSSVPMTMEQFYATAIDADYLVYNASIDGPVNSMNELLAKSELFADFKAVKDGNVWTTGKSLYQATDTVGKLITDMNVMLTGGDQSQMTFLTKVE